MLKAKNKIPSRIQRKCQLISNLKAFLNLKILAKRNIKSREKHETKRPKLTKDQQDSINKKLEQLKPERENFFEKRENRKNTEENRQKEASGFIRKLKMEKRQREKNKFQKPAKIDDEYIQKLEDMMKQRKLKEVSFMEFYHIYSNFLSRIKKKSKNDKKSKLKYRK